MFIIFNTQTGMCKIIKTVLIRNVKSMYTLQISVSTQAYFKSTLKHFV